jgi:2,4-diketo-3-deoxy-L-fuconate hydrolase
MNEQSPFGLGTFAGADEVAFPGLVVAERGLDLRDSIGEHRTTLDLLNEWDDSLPILRGLAESGREPAVPIADLRPLATVTPRQLLCAGANYFQHVREITFSFSKNNGDSRPDEEIRADAEVATRRRREDDDRSSFQGSWVPYAALEMTSCSGAPAGNMAGSLNWRWSSAAAQTR